MRATICAPPMHATRMPPSLRYTWARGHVGAWVHWCMGAWVHGHMTAEDVKQGGHRGHETRGCIGWVKQVAILREDETVGA